MNHELVQAALFPSPLYNDLSEEIQQHLQEKIEELVASGMPRKEAAAAAGRDFGNITLVQEDSRAVWRWPSIEGFFYALRFLRPSRCAPHDDRTLRRHFLHCGHALE